MSIFDDLISRISGDDPLSNQGISYQNNPYAVQQPQPTLAPQYPHPYQPQDPDANLSWWEKAAKYAGAAGGDNQRDAFEMQTYKDGMNPDPQYKDMSQYSSIGNLVNSLNGMAQTTGQSDYQNFMPVGGGMGNSYIQQLLQRGR